MKFIDHMGLMLVIAVLSIPVYSTLAKVFWGEKYESFGKTLKYLLWPDLYSLLRGKFWDDWEETLKFKIYLLLCISWSPGMTEILARHVL